MYIVCVSFTKCQFLWLLSLRWCHKNCFFLTEIENLEHVKELNSALLLLSIHAHVEVHVYLHMSQSLTKWILSHSSVLGAKGSSSNNVVVFS